MTNTRPSGIVVGVDGTLAGQAALEFAMSEASRRGSALEVVTTWEWDCSYETATCEQKSAEPRARAERAQEVAVSAALTATLAAPPVISRHVIEGDAGIALLSIARDADYLVVGIADENAVKRALLGSVSHYCILHATCPVVVMPLTKPVPGRLTETFSREPVPQPVR